MFTRIVEWIKLLNGNRQLKTVTCLRFVPNTIRPPELVSGSSL